MSSLLLDLAIEILLRLPVKSLLRFRCLSKTFRTEIDSSYFVKTHIKKSIERKIGLKLITETGYKYTYPYYADIDEGLRKANIMDNFPFLRSPEGKTIYSTPRIKGSCNGLLLIVVHNFQVFKNHWDFFLWNPFTRQYKNIPSCPHPFLINKYVNRCGFGYDSASDDYKIVMFSQFSGENKRFRVGVYSLRSNSWKIIQDLYLNHPIILRDGIFIDNALYWQCTAAGDNKFKSNEIFGFNLADETFFKFELTSNPPQSYSLLEVLDNKLHLVTLAPDDKNQQVYLWVDYDKGRKGGESVRVGFWKKAFVLKGEKNQKFVTLISSKKGGKVLFYASGYKVFRYNHERKIREKARIKGRKLLHGEKDYYLHRTCWESLVSPCNYGC